MPDGRSRLPAHQASSSDSARNTAAKPSRRRLGGVSISGIERDGNWAVIGPAWIIRKNGPLLSNLLSRHGYGMAGIAGSGQRGDRQSGGAGNRESVRVSLGGCRIIKKTRSE